MKTLHRQDLFGWSHFDESRNIDFHGLLWVREGGNVAIDPLPMSEHDLKHLDRLGGLALIVVTNSDHVRSAEALARRFGAKLAGPRAEQASFPCRCELWLGEGDEPVPGLRVLELHGSKTPGELALILERTTLITGDLVRAHMGGRLALLPDPKLSNKAEAHGSVRRLAELTDIEAVLVGDGWPVFRDGHRALEELAQGFGA